MAEHVPTIEGGAVPIPDGQHEFRPDWTIAPAAVLQAEIAARGISLPTLAVMCVGSEHEVAGLRLIEDVLNCEPLTETHAAMLARSIGTSARFWLALEHNYRAGLAAGLADCTPDPGWPGWSRT